MVQQYKNLRTKRHKRVRGKIKGTKQCPRLSVFRSDKHIYAQLVDDVRGVTLVAASDLEKALLVKQVKRIEIAYEVGRVLAEKSIKQGVRKVVFDRGGYRYHGRVKALAEGARKGGLQF